MLPSQINQNSKHITKKNDVRIFFCILYFNIKYFSFHTFIAELDQTIIIIDRQVVSDKIGVLSVCPLHSSFSFIFSIKIMRLILLFLAVFLCRVTAHQCDAETECSDDETCCKLGDNTWGCCPMPNAVCCDDRSHCCPTGTTCDPQGARCIGADEKHVPMKKKKPARKTVERNQFNEVVCPDKASKCPDGSTCCLLEQGSYGCCPVPNAVCCADMLHCCPNGFTCHGQFCSQNFAMIPHLRKFASTSIHRKPAVEFLSEEEEDDDDEESTSSEDPESDVDPIACGVGKTCPAKTTCCNVRGKNGEPKTMCCPLSNFNFRPSAVRTLAAQPAITVLMVESARSTLKL
uniref:ProGRaNulin homolog n=2 Tax=Caenorhabditis elegans TaxID=6239 RepID=Q7JKP2_CAEEL|eukprot:NP_492982.1 ProGRaNulin homolog [Caenorhabditis elegans]